MTETLFDSGRFREVLGHFATGVAVITAAAASGPVAMVVSSFTSVSLDPPLVAFLPDKKSTSWPAIEASGHFCVNILRADQHQLCAQFAVKGGDKFAGVDWRLGRSGAPILDGVMAWIDCALAQTFESGDHYIAVGEVLALEAADLADPLVFFQGSYGAFSQRERTDTVGAFDDVIGDFIRRLHTTYQDVADRGLPADQTLSVLLSSAFDDMETDPVAVMVLQNERDRLSTRPEFAYLEPIENAIADIWTGVIRRGIDEGIFRPDLNVTMTFRFIRDALFNAARWYRPQGPTKRREISDHYVSLVLQGIHR